MPDTDMREMERRKAVFLSSSSSRLRMEPGTGNMFEVQGTQVNKDMFKVLCGTGQGTGLCGGYDKASQFIQRMC